MNTQEAIKHLTLWGQRPVNGLARVESVNSLDLIKSVGVEFNSLNIHYSIINAKKVETTPCAKFNYILSELALIESGVVSLVGFDDNLSNEETLTLTRILNFNRENLAGFNLTQIWWVSRKFGDCLLLHGPDLNSWFCPRIVVEE
jgi:hypothetical protein